MLLCVPASPPCLWQVQDPERIMCRRRWMSPLAEHIGAVAVEVRDSLQLSNLLSEEMLKQWWRDFSPDAEQMHFIQIIFHFFLGRRKSCLKSSYPFCSHVTHSTEGALSYSALAWLGELPWSGGGGWRKEHCLWKQEDLSWIPAPTGHYCIDHGHFLSPMSSSEKYTSPYYNVGLLWRLKEVRYLMLLTQNEWLFLQHLLHCTTPAAGHGHCSLCGRCAWCCIYAADLDRQSKQQFSGDFSASEGVGGVEHVTTGSTWFQIFCLSTMLKTRLQSPYKRTKTSPPTYLPHHLPLLQYILCPPVAIFQGISGHRMYFSHRSPMGHFLCIYLRIKPCFVILWDLLQNGQERHTQSSEGNFCCKCQISKMLSYCRCGSVWDKIQVSVKSQGPALPQPFTAEKETIDLITLMHASVFPKTRL